MEIQSINCSSVITKGGAKRMISPWVGFANNPLSLNFKQTSHASFPSLGFITMALSNPLPLTRVIISLSKARSSFLNILPNQYAFLARFSSITTSSAACATLQARGLPPKVEPCSPG